MHELCTGHPCICVTNITSCSLGHPLARELTGNAVLLAPHIHLVIIALAGNIQSRSNIIECSAQVAPMPVCRATANRCCDRTHCAETPAVRSHPMLSQSYPLGSFEASIIAPIYPVLTQYLCRRSVVIQSLAAKLGMMVWLFVTRPSRTPHR